MLDYPSDIRSKQIIDMTDAELDAWCKDIELKYPYPGPCWNCGRTETHVILPDIGEVRCYCGCTNACMIGGVYTIVQDVWDND